MQKQTTYVGMDVHARTIRVTVLRPNEAQREEWGLANEPRSVASLARRLLRDARGPLVACYEAGPTGFALMMRQLRAKGVDCQPRPPPAHPDAASEPGIMIGSGSTPGRTIWLQPVLRLPMPPCAAGRRSRSRATRDAARCNLCATMGP